MGGLTKASKLEQGNGRANIGVCRARFFSHMAQWDNPVGLNKTFFSPNWNYQEDYQKYGSTSTIICLNFTWGVSIEFILCLRNVFFNYNRHRNQWQNKLDLEGDLQIAISQDIKLQFLKIMKQFKYSALIKNSIFKKNYMPWIKIKYFHILFISNNLSFQNAYFMYNMMYIMYSYSNTCTEQNINIHTWACYSK